MYEQATDLPSYIDWRERGAVNDIKEQGKCGRISNSGFVDSCRRGKKLDNSTQRLSVLRVLTIRL